jgi:peptidoglycan/LPS O-acetylase OafA/YrhL
MTGNRLNKPENFTVASKFLKVLESKTFHLFAIVFSLSAALLYFPEFSESLIASRQNLLGIFTAIVVHKEFAHFFVNFLLTFTAILLFSFSSSFSNPKKDNFVAYAVLFVAIIANLSYIIAFPISRVYGSSGIVSAFLGGTMMFALANAWNQRSKFRKMAQSSIGVFLFLALIVAIFYTDHHAGGVFVYLVSFFLAAVLVSLYQHLASTPRGHQI